MGTGGAGRPFSHRNSAQRDCFGVLNTVYCLSHGSMAPVGGAEEGSINVSQKSGPIVPRAGLQDQLWRPVFEALQRGQLERAQSALEASLAQPAR